MRDQGSLKIDISNEKDMSYFMKEQRNNSKDEDQKEEIEGKTFIIKKKSSYPSAYYEYFNQELDFSNQLYHSELILDGSEESEDEHKDASMITMIEKHDYINSNSLWEEEDDDESKEENSESDEEVKTYRLSNPCTPIQDLEKVPVEIDNSFLIQDTKKKHIMNNLLYGNYMIKEEAKNTVKSKLQYRVSPSKSMEEDKNKKFTTLKNCGYNMKMVFAPSKTKIYNNCVSPGLLNKNRLTGSLENIKSFTKDASIFASTVKQPAQNSVSKAFKRRGSDKPNINNELVSNLSSANTSVINSYMKSDNKKATKNKNPMRFSAQNSFRDSLFNQNNSIKILKKLTSKNSRNKVMVVNKTTKKLKPLFPLPASLMRKKPDSSCNTTLRQQSSETKAKFEDCSLKRNELLLSKLCSMASKNKNKNNKIKENCDKTVNFATQLDTELLIAHSFK